MRRLEDIFVGGWFLGLVGLCFFTIIGGVIHNDIERSSCDEACKPYKVMSCARYDSKFFHPKYVDVIVVCDGGEMKAKHIIK